MRREKGQLKINVLVLSLVIGLLISGVVYNFYVAAEDQQPQVEEKQSSPEEILTEARQFYYSGNYEASIDQYKRLMDTSKEKEALINLAAVYEELGNYQAAIKQYQQLLQKEQTAKYNLGLGIGHYNLNQLGQAKQALAKIVEESKEKTEDYVLRETYYYLGLIAEQQADYQQAEEYFQAALEQRSFALGYYQLGEVNFAQNRYQVAKKYYRQALRTDGSLKGVNYKLGLTYLELNQPQSGIKYLQRARRENSRLTVVKDKLAALKQKYPDYFPDDSGDDEQLPPDRKIPERTNFRDIQPLPHPGPELRVGIMENKQQVKFRTDSDFVVKQSGEVLVEGKAGQLVTAELTGEQGRLVFGEQKISFTSPVTIVPEKYSPVVVYNVGFGAGYYWAGKEHRQYRGKLELRLGAEGITAVNLVQLEEYLLAVVPSEMSASWPLEALKVQAVAARSYTLANIGKHNSAGYDLCSTVHCAAYRGLNREASRVDQAVRSTAGEVMTYNGHPINAVYSANSGGHTENSEDVWSAEVPYLRGVSTELNKSNFPLAPAELKTWLKEVPASYSRGQKYTKLSHYRWQRSLSLDYLEARLGVDNIKQIIPRERGEAGSVKSVLVVGAEEEKIVSSALRSRLGGLRSNRFWVQPQYQDGQLVSFLFYGSGWGHSVGMDQVAVAGMAEADKEYQTILRHFYSGVKIEDWY